MTFKHKQSFFSSNDQDESLERHLNDQQSVIKHTFETICQELETRGWGKDALLDIYIKGIHTGEKAFYPGTELGTQSFFEDILGKENSTRSIGNHDDYVIAELICAIARAISIGNMSTTSITSSPVPSSTHRWQI